MFSKFVMLAAGIGAIFGLIKMKQGNEIGKAIVIACALLAILLAGFNAKEQLSRGRGGNREEIKKRIQNEAIYQRISGEKLGQELAKKYPDAKAVIIRPMQINDIEATAESLADAALIQRMDGLKSGLGEAIEILAVLHPPVDDSTLDEYNSLKKSYMQDTGKNEVSNDFYAEYLPFRHDLSDVDRFNKLTRSIPSQATMVILIADMPDDLEKLTVWKKKLIVAGISTDPSPKMKSAIEAGYITDMIVGNPSFDSSSLDLPKDLEECFNGRFLYITPQNVNEIAAENERLFPQ